MGVSIEDGGPCPARSLGEEAMESLIIQVKRQAKRWRAFAAEAHAVCIWQSRSCRSSLETTPRTGT